MLGLSGWHFMFAGLLIGNSSSGPLWTSKKYGDISEPGVIWLPMEIIEETEKALAEIDAEQAAGWAACTQGVSNMIALFSVTTVVREYSGFKDVPFHCFYNGDRPYHDPERPFAELIEGYDPDDNRYVYAEEHIHELFAEEEAQQLKAYLDAQADVGDRLHREADDAPGVVPARPDPQGRWADTRQARRSYQKYRAKGDRCVLQRRRIVSEDDGGSQ
jgi:hypothetical protein